MEISAICRRDRISKQNEVAIIIRLYHNGIVRKITSGLRIKVDYWDFDNKSLKNGIPNQEHLQYLLDKQIQEFKKRELEYKIQGKNYSIDDIIGIKKKPAMTVEEYFQKIINELSDLGRLNTRDKYKFTLSSLNKFRSTKISFTDMDFQFLKDYEMFLRKSGLADNSIATKFSTLKSVFNKALEEEIFVCNKNPFKKFKVGSLWTSTRKRAINKETISQLSRLDLSVVNACPKSYLELARDIFMFSYLTAGINFKDIAFLKYANIENNRIYYVRHKTKKMLTFNLLPEARKILDKYSKTDAEEDDYIFPILDKKIHVTEQQIFDRIQKVRGRINKSLGYISEAMNLKHRLTTYVARHSFATVLKRSGVNIGIISELMGHANLATTEIYLDGFEEKQVEQAMQHLV